MEDQVERLVLAVLSADLSLDFLEQLGAQVHVTGLVDTVNITETSGNGEVGGDGGESLVDGEDVLGLSVEGVVVNILVVATVLLTTGDTDFLVSLASSFHNVGKGSLPSRATASWGQHA